MIFRKTLSNRKKLLKAGIIAALFFNAEFIFGQTIKPSPDQKMYTKQDLKFEITIPNAKAENVLIQTQTLPAGVSLRTLRKTEVYGEVSGTLVEFWYNFEKPGDYELPRITVLVNSKRRYYYYEAFNISENPANMLPRIVIEFENGKVINSDDSIPSKPVFDYPIGEKIKFRVNLQYATQLVQFNWDIPKDSIFTQLQTYEITEIKYREKNYTSDLIPVADFEWTVLSKGLNAIPKIRLVATAYNGYRNELLISNFAVNFTDSKNSSENDSLLDSMFSAAFTSTNEKNQNNLEPEVTLEQCQELATLRHGEKYNFFHSYEYRKQRIELEEYLNLPTEYDEYYAGFLALAVISFVVLVGLLVLFIKKKMSLMQIFVTVLLIFSLTAIMVSSIRISKDYGISTGADLYTIPEESSNSSGSIKAGNRVQILEKAGDWYFVEMGSINGWTKTDKIIGW